MYWYLITHLLYFSSNSLLFSSSPPLLSVCVVLPSFQEDSNGTEGRPPHPDHPDPLDPSQPASLWGLVPLEAVSWTRQKASCSMVVSRFCIIPHLPADPCPGPPLLLHWVLSGLQLGRSRSRSLNASRASFLNSLKRHRAGQNLDNHGINILTRNPKPPFSTHTQTYSRISILIPRTRQYHRCRKKEGLHLLSALAGCATLKTWGTKWAHRQHRGREAAPALQYKDVRAQASLVITWKNRAGLA